MENPKNQCSLPDNKNTNAISFCQKCNIYMCNKCQNLHTELFKIHQTVNLTKEIDDFFPGICKNENHLNNLDFYCKTHNQLCCAGCITIIKSKNFGQHSDCEIYNIEEIKEEKKAKLTENINNLENLSKSLDKSINDLKQMSEKINQNKENVKIKIQKIFTKIRNALDKREDQLLSEVDSQLEKLFFDEDFVRKSEKLPNNIKKSLDLGKQMNKEWNNDRLNAIIHNCINIENSINEINMISENIEKFNNMNDLEVKFSPPNEYQLNDILDTIKNFGKIYYNNFKYSFIKIGPLNEYGENNNNNKKSGISIKPKIDVPGLDIKIPKVEQLKIVEPIKQVIKPQIMGVKAQKLNQINQFVPQIKEVAPKLMKVEPIFMEINDPKIAPVLDINVPKIQEEIKSNDLIINKIPIISNPEININMNYKRKYKISGEKDNILSKTVSENNWMGSICMNELKNTEENIWKIKILKTQNKCIMVGVAPIDFDINSSIYDYGWYFYCYDSTLYSGPPHNFVHKETNLSKVNDEIKIVMNMKTKTIKFIINDEDKGESYSNIPTDKPLAPVVLLYNKDDSIEILDNN